MENLIQGYENFRNRLPGKLPGAVLDGCIKGVKTAFFLLKIIVPVFILVTLLKYSFLMPLLQEALGPVMAIFNLPADAGVPIVTGFFADEYAASTAMRSFEFGVGASTTIAMIIIVAHSLPVELAIAKKIGLPGFGFLVFRIVAAALIGIAVGWLGVYFL